MKHSFEDICRIAKKAAAFDLDTDEGYDALRLLALKEGINKDTLIYYTNAYEAGGESGIKALTHKKPLPDKKKTEAEELINKFLQSRIPQNHPDKLWFRTVTQHNRITASERRPYFADPSRTTTSEFAQFRYTDYDDKWHLYWKRSSGKWWPYIPKNQIKTIQDCLREISEDKHGCFWG